jgi:hypothetical protein
MKNLNPNLVSLSFPRSSLAFENKAFSFTINHFPRNSPHRRNRFSPLLCDLDSGMNHLYLQHQIELQQAFEQDLQPTNSVERALIEQMAINQAHMRALQSLAPVESDDPEAALKQLLEIAKLTMRCQAKMLGAYQRLLTDRRRAAREQTQPQPATLPAKTAARPAAHANTLAPQPNPGFRQMPAAHNRR